MGTIGEIKEVSINSTSEEVRSFVSVINPIVVIEFPLIQLPRKSEAYVALDNSVMFDRVSINSTSEEVRSL